jgi:hypothetical protein
MQRPTAVTVFGVLNIGFAAMGVISLISTLFMFRNLGDQKNPVIQLMHDNPTYTAWLKISIPLGVVALIVLLIAGIGLLQMKNWGRNLSLIYGIYALLMGIVGIAVTYQCLVIPLMQQAQNKSGPEYVGAMAGAIGASIGSLFSLIYPILLIVFMTRPKLIAAFRTAEAGGYRPNT